jgi:uncharacterized protein YnzC (UPF0291/DUF896 family)
MRFADSGNSDSGYYSTVNKQKREQISEELTREQKVLEEMVLDSIKRGGCNLGENISILKQSCKLDKLIVDEMTLRESEDTYAKKYAPTAAE